MGEMWGFVALAVWTGWLGVIDVRTRRLPDRLTLPGAAVVLTAAAIGGDLRPALVGAALLAGGYLLVRLVSPAAMGGGDVKLALGLGAVTGVAGAQVWLTAALGAFALTALAGIALHASGRPHTQLPHGPSMCVATLVALAL